jgi:two-component system CheB/CheR fusion protein
MSGLAMAREHIFDVIICDIGLPGMDGYEVIRQLRLQSLNPVPCLVALTGYDQPEHRTRAIEVGFDHYLVKPIAMNVLMNIISSNASQ